MLPSGLVLRKVFLYAVKVRERRERYLGGVKALGDHMHMVTKRMSIAPTIINNKSNNSVVSKPAQMKNLAHRSLNASKDHKTASRASSDPESVWISRTLEIKDGCCDS